MNIIVPVQLVPDLVEELVIDSNDTRLDPMSVRWIINEFDDYAIEQAILLKERHGGTVTIVAPGLSDIDDALFTAAAKGADRLIKVIWDVEDVNNHMIASMYAKLLSELRPDLILTGVAAHHQLDGSFGAILAAKLEMPYAGYISAVNYKDGNVIVKKEFPGGVLSEMELQLPAVLGIQAADTPPRYIPISKIRQAMKTGKIDEEDAPNVEANGVTVERIYLPELSGRALMVEGSVDQIVDEIAKLIHQQGIF
jgi:electron transfer flavoprotein beta subunit